LIAVGVLALFLVFIAAGMPVFIAMAISAIVGNFGANGADMLLTNTALDAYSSIDSPFLLSVPLYVFAGCLLEATGLSRKLFDFAGMVCSGMRGGLGVATVIACSIFAAISGSSVATAATIGLVALPAMADHGYRRSASGALVAAGGTLGILIPPSIPLIIFGLMTDQSIGALFVAGVVPGVVLAVMMAIYTAVTSKVSASTTRYTWGDRLRILREAFAVLSLPVLVFIGIYTGIATATEVAALAVFYILVIGLATHTLNLRKLSTATMSTLRSTAMIFVLVAFGAMMTSLFTQSGVPQAMVSAISNLGLSPLLVFTLMVLLYLVLGMFLEALSMMVVTVPILFPVATALGIPPLAFGVFVVLAVEAAQITPPVGINLFTIAKIGNVPFGEMSRAIVPYVVLLLTMMYLVYFIPGIATWLPSTMHYGK
jgi:C4-dicarboxylate transporter, DctM subunit